MAEWIAPERLYLTADNRVVTGHGPERVKLLVAAGGRLPMTVALAYGLVVPDPPPVVESDPGPAAKEVPAPPADKAVRGPRATK